MTGKQAQLYNWLLKRIDEPVAPTFDEMCAAIGAASKSSVSRLLDRLEQQGLIQKEGGKARSIRAIRRDPFDGVSTGAITAELERRRQDYAAFDAGIVPLSRAVVRIYERLKANTPGNWDGPLDEAVSTLRRALQDRD